MKAAKYVVVALALTLLAGCVLGGDGRADFDRGQDGYFDGGHGPDLGYWQGRNDLEYRPY
jgi:hypothetical protein